MILLENDSVQLHKVRLVSLLPGFYSTNSSREFWVFTSASTFWCLSFIGDLILHQAQKYNGKLTFVKPPLSS